MQYWQEITVGVVLAAVAGRILWTLLRPKKKDKGACCCCPLQGECGKAGNARRPGGKDCGLKR